MAVRLATMAVCLVALNSLIPSLVLLHNTATPYIDSSVA